MANQPTNGISEHAPPPPRRASTRANGNGTHAPGSAVQLPDCLPPHSYEAEAACLGGALISRAAARQILEALAREDFYLDVHRRVYDVLAYLERERDTPPDVLTVPEELRRRGQLESVGGLAYIGQLAESVPTARHVEYYARTVVEKSTLRKLIGAGNEIIALAHEQEREVAQIAERARGLVQRITLPRQNADFADGIYADELLRLALAEARWAVPGLIPEGLSVLAGRAKLGKSWLVLQILVAIAFGGQAIGVPVEQGRTLYLALEDTRRRLQTRLLQILGEADAEALARETDAETARLPLHLFTRWPRWGTGGKDRLYGYLERYPDTRLIVVDTYAKIADAAAAEGNAYEHDSKRWGELKLMADECGVSVLVVHHFNKLRAAEDWVDQISGSTGISGTADGILGFFRERDKGHAVIKVTGRDIEDAEDRVVSWDPHSAWTPSTLSPEDLARSREQEAVLAALRSIRREVKPADLAVVMERNPSTLRGLLRRMFLEGVLTCEDSRYGLPEWRGERGSGQQASRNGRVGSTGSTVETAVNTSTASTASRLTVDPVDPVDPVESVEGVESTFDFSAPREPCPELALPEDMEPGEREARRNAWGLGWAYQWPALFLCQGAEIPAGEEGWQHACTAWFVGYLARVPEKLARP